MNEPKTSSSGLAVTMALDSEPMAPPETPWQEFLRIFQKDYQALFGFWVLMILLVTALAGKALTEWWVVFDPEVVRLTDKFLPPFSVPSAHSLSSDRPFGGVYLLGTDELGRDVFARMFQGSFVSLSVGFVAVGISLTIGILLGGLAGYYGQIKLGFISVDTLIMRFTDAMMCFPVFFLILTSIALSTPSIYTIMIIIGIFGWMGTARFVRAEFLALREQDFVTAAKALGIPERRIIFRHMVPNALAPVFVSAIIGVASAILTESGFELFGVWSASPLCYMGKYSFRWEGFCVRRTVALFHSRASNFCGRAGL